MEFSVPEWADRIDSTNQALLAAVQRGERLPSGYVLAALEQTAGRGRHGRRWISRPGRDLTFSFLLWLTEPPVRRASLLQATALGVSDWLIRQQHLAATVKWPNDVLVRDRKISGVLAEQAAVVGPAGEPVVVGVGINVNATAEELAAVGRPATSLRAETGRETDARSVLPDVLAAIERRLVVWERGGFAALRKDWMRRCADVGRTVRVVNAETNAPERIGRVVGFGEAGEMLLRQADGSVVSVWSGDVLQWQPPR
ncbi:MAG: biotin--[acetyl-CoA-carboxylase] ligase [Planctomycetota bacterium]|nr:MAG: biotin--[acetyl-CoA-carboxylase] ligase [Planctomycetota bacterium]